MPWAGIKQAFGLLLRGGRCRGFIVLRSRFLVELISNRIGLWPAVGGDEPRAMPWAGIKQAFGLQVRKGLTLQGSAVRVLIVNQIKPSYMP